MRRTEAAVGVIIAACVAVGACALNEAKNLDREAVVCDDALNADCAASANVIVVEDER